ncbi:hypothetical protein [Halorussus litoreus]|uniref:hypothetical protein n=1 Tax=Halorussus litoreus TaxID=1710536 RepID=UPI000E272E1B|nr:hypothetical protein [Halorussus litoreus]
MTRFDADSPEDRQKLFAEGIAAHRERASAFVTFEAHRDAAAGEEFADAAEVEEAGEGDDEDDTERAPPWIQFGDGVCNLDCTDEELEDLKRLLSEFPAFKVDELNRPEETEGVNVRVSALADANRVAQFVERAFREVYDQPETFRAWVTAV